MNCDHCDKPAVVHETVVKNGVTKEVHLCQAHAAAAGYVLPEHQPLNQLLSSFIPAGSGRRSPAAPACPQCGLTVAQFRQSGTLGCEHCYESFGPALEPLIERAHAGGTHHVGRTPRRGGEGLDLRALRMRLVRELDEAVAAEQYERAAELRDRLHELGRGGSEAPAEPASE
jgi:protein arginine kinase activator